VVEDRFAAVFEGNPDVQEILPPELASLRRFHPELCLNLHGGTRSMLLTGSSGARIRAGFSHHNGAQIYNCRIPRAQEILGEERVVHTAEHLASAMFYLGAARIETPRARLFAPKLAVERPYVVIHAVAAQPKKTWSADGFLAVADTLSSRLEPVFIAGAGEDLWTFAKYRTIVGAPLSETKSLLQSASLFLGNDSGPAHMAAAFGVPVVVLFGPSDPAIWAPWKVTSRVVADKDNIRNIPVESVLQAIEEIAQ
jgi:ADP-heptose:LPS heptosyltransferase